MERSQPEMNKINRATGDVNAIFGGGDGRGNDSTPPLPPHTLGVSSGTASMTTQQAATFSMGGNATNAVKKSASLYQMMMGGTPTQKNTGVGGN